MDRVAVTNISPLRPAEYTMQQLITGILEGKYPPGSNLPAERKLANELGVTRPTLREALRQLAAEGWITIRHGKPTQVNHYFETGGLGLLSTLVKHAANISLPLILHLLEFRMILMPPVARLAAWHAADSMLSLLSKHPGPDDGPDEYTRYDWNLQVTMAKEAKNPIFPMILNDFESIFHVLGSAYFSFEKARRASCTYYKRLYAAVLSDSGKIEKIVRDAMEESISIFLSITNKKKP